MRTLLAAVLCLVSLPLLAQPSLILTNGKIFDNPNAQAIAITGNTITAVGSAADIGALATPETRVIDVKGGLVIPGFNDAHTHPGTYTQAFVANENIEATWAQVAAAIAAATDETPAELWITAIAGPAIITDANITSQTLDKLAPDRKVLIGSFTGHGAILSSAALQALGIANDAKDPMGGAFGRDAQGNLNGRVTEYAHYLVDRRFADLASDEEIVAGIRAFSEEATRYGITSVQAMPTPNEARFAKLLRASGVPLRVRHIAFPLDGTSAVVENGGAVKFILDGTPIERGAALRTTQYPDKTRGSENFTDLAPFVKLAAGKNAQLLFHTAGDKTIASALRAFENSTLKRPRLEHGDGLQPDLFPLAQKTGAVVVINPAHFPFRGAYPAAGKYMLAKSIAAAKIPLAIGSDGPLNPGLNLMFATARPDTPAESLTRAEAVGAYTSGSAYAEFMETKKGKIAPGMLADLAVLSQDILEVPAEALPGTRSVLTIIDGKVVHEEP